MALRDALVFLDGFLPTPAGEVVVRKGLPSMQSQGGVCALQAYRRAGSSTAGQIILRPDLADLNTAGGVALLGHEVLHQVQYDSVPDLERRYIQEERRVRGQPPYMNGWEWPAYVVEARVFREALAAGYPAGPHVPLLVLDGLA